MRWDGPKAFVRKVKAYKTRMEFKVVGAPMVWQRITGRDRIVFKRKLENISWTKNFFYVAHISSRHKEKRMWMFLVLRTTKPIQNTQKNFQLELLSCNAFLHSTFDHRNLTSWLFTHSWTFIFDSWVYRLIIPYFMVDDSTCLRSKRESSKRTINEFRRMKRKTFFLLMVSD